MTNLHERILTAAYPLFIRRGIRDVTVDDIQRAAGVSPREFESEFSSRDDLASECLELREREWTAGIVEAGARARGTTPEGRLLAIFDVFDDWFHRDDYEACTFINVLLEMGRDHPLGRASIGYLGNIRTIVSTLAAEAHLRDADDFALSWHVLMKGSIINAVEGDRDAALRAKSMARDLIGRHHGTELPRELAHDDVDWFDGCAPDAGFLDIDESEALDAIGRLARSTSGETSTPGAATALPERSDVLWSMVRRDLWVGRQAGEFAGMVEEIAGTFSSTSRHGRFVGTFHTLADAERSLGGEPDYDSAAGRV